MEERKKALGYNRLHAAWYFTFTLWRKGKRPSDTTGFMPRGISISTYGGKEKGPQIPPALCRVVFQFQPREERKKALTYHRLYAAWYFNFNLWNKGKGTSNTTGFIPDGLS